MAEYVLRLLEIPENVRGPAVEAARGCGPPFDRVAFNGILTGTRKPPVEVARGEDRGTIIALRDTMVQSGCRADVIEEGGVRAVASVAGTISALPPAVKAAVAVGTALLLVLIGVGANSMFGSPDKMPAMIPGTSTTAVAQTATVSGTSTVAKMKPKYFQAFTAKILPEAPTCPEGLKPTACNVARLNTLGEKVAAEALEKATAEAARATETPDGGVAVDAGEPADTGIVVRTIPAQDYLSVLKFRIVRCMAEERSKLVEGQEAGIELGLGALETVLINQPGKAACTDSRSAMYECLATLRAMRCEATNKLLEAAFIESGERQEVADWTASFADAAGDRILECLRAERDQESTPMERAGVHLFRYKVAAALSASKGDCTEDQYTSCAGEMRHRLCDTFGPTLDPDAARFVVKTSSACASLAVCPPPGL